MFLFLVAHEPTGDPPKNVETLADDVLLNQEPPELQNVHNHESNPDGGQSSSSGQLPTEPHVETMLLFLFFL